MCPLRVILLFLSAILAGYLAVKTVKAQQESSILDPSEESPKQAIEHKGLFAVVSIHSTRDVQFHALILIFLKQQDVLRLKHKAWYF